MPSNWGRPFSAVPSNGTKDNRHKLGCRKFHMNIRKNFFTLRVTEHWNRLPREVVESGDIQDLPGCLPVLPTIGNLL